MKNQSLFFIFLPPIFRSFTLIAMRTRFWRGWMGHAVTISVVVLVGSSWALGADAPRAARSVHLHWKAPDGDLFYQEMTVERSVPGSYFMAAGWSAINQLWVPLL